MKWYKTNYLDKEVMLSVTSLIEDIASITSFVKLWPTPADPISAVGLIAWKMEKKIYEPWKSTMEAYLYPLWFSLVP